MKVAVFGATGDTGKPLVNQLLMSGHEVTAIVRSPEKLELSGERIEIVKGNVLNSSTLGGTLTGKDAVISVIGGNFRHPTTVYSKGMRNIIKEMEKSGVTRLICLSAETLKSKEETSFMGRILVNILWKVFHHLYTDMQRMEDEIYQSDLEWTIVRPPYLTNGKPKMSYRINFNETIPKGSGHINRSDLALAMIHQLKNTDSNHSVAYVCSK